MTGDQIMGSDTVAVQPLPARPISAEAFLPFGHLILPGADGAPADLADQALNLAGGRPRFYIMDLSRRSHDITRITRHRAVTQVLASANAQPWLLAVAPPRDLEQPDAAPDPAAIRAFTIPGGVAVLLHRGTWHAGPYFHAPSMPFFNLELVDTNEVDHHTVTLPVAMRLTESPA